ncbi:hypothetical protein BDK51DRAFT_34463 [Blyttiomyces helicus]|uniref:Uncharacterized protein n=1 Tax=Blyttiomyces helicus TaxID=388810 RepID=A0A4P9W6Z9_9FUNG|nr:hypothetical protein BDK51DRAFT_34463 [Blyttiomyces helicus]|eukprot:RKO88114.1 hypothetical protein BDK51DRAFT_34463 [Blyttiomyces helicus]
MAPSPPRSDVPGDLTTQNEIILLSLKVKPRKRIEDVQAASNPASQIHHILTTTSYYDYPETAVERAAELQWRGINNPEERIPVDADAAFAGVWLVHHVWGIGPTSTFPSGQAYVAMSRVRSFDNLRIFGSLPPSEILKPDARVVAFYEKLRRGGRQG